MFRPATVSSSVHVKAGPGGKHWATPWPEVGPLLCFSKKKSVTGKVMSDSDNEGLNCRRAACPDPSNEANKDASELQEAAAKKAKWKSWERVWELGPNNRRLQFHQEWDRMPCKKIDGQTLEGSISSMHSRKKRATDLRGWKYKDRFVKVNPSI
jgi:hypothetical protein